MQSLLFICNCIIEKVRKQREMRRRRGLVEAEEERCIPSENKD